MYLFKKGEEEGEEKNIVHTQQGERGSPGYTYLANWACVRGKGEPAVFNARSPVKLNCNRDKL